MKKKFHPPRLAQWILKVSFNDRGEYTHLGDFGQVFEHIQREEGGLKAWLWYWGQTIKTFPWILSNKIYWSLAMLKNYVTTAFRNMFKNKGFSLINITGLAIGMAACLLIFLFVQDELNYDKYHAKSDRIYRLAVDFKMRSQEMEIATVGPVTAGVLLDLYPEIEDIVRFRSMGDMILEFGNTSFKETKAIYSDPSFFNIFSIPLVSGEEKSALSQPNSLVLSRATAEKYFGNTDPLGKTLRVENREDYIVTGVYEKIPDNSHFHFDIILSMASLEESREQTWMSLNFNTYLLLKNGADTIAFEKKLEDLVLQRVGAEVAQITGVPANYIWASGVFKFRFYLQRLEDIHLHSNLLAELEPNSDIKYVYIFSAIALFILLIAAINFMNLSTARSAGRAKEVGIRKVLGSQRFQLIRQFISESFFFSLLSMFFALILVSLVLPFFNHLSGKSLHLSSLAELFTIIVIFLVIFFTGFFSGLYPSFFLSAFQPSIVLKGQLRKGVRSGQLRSTLVVFQFVASIILIVGTLVVYRQLSFIQNKKLGYEKEQVLVLDNAYLLRDQARPFKNSLLDYPEFVSGTVSGYLPVPSGRNTSTIFPEGEVVNSTAVEMWSVDHDYIKTLDMSIVQGRDFSRDYSTDETAAIINQRTVREFGWEDPLGKRIVQSITAAGKKIEFTVIGVVEDFHFESLRENIGPLLLHIGSSNSLISFRVRTADISRTISLLQRRWKEALPNQPFNYFFMDDRFDTVYRSEKQVGEIFGVFAALAVLIGCLGLFGLASFTAELRTKEIGIRKVMGASVPSIFRLMMKEFLGLIILANLIAWPIAYIMMKKWLQEFAYKTPISIWIFLVAGLAALLTALLTVSYQSIKSALSNPIRSLRYE
ncbi:ABC transporter permease [Acidobacteriota bacterium]